MLVIVYVDDEHDSVNVCVLYEGIMLLMIPRSDRRQTSKSRSACLFPLSSVDMFKFLFLFPIHENLEIDGYLNSRRGTVALWCSVLMPLPTCSRLFVLATLSKLLNYLMNQ